ncbi:MAG: CPBP family intramembrane metalloprotease [Acidobacteriia bacterium]|nr:CPBP family intramembrane metalloprotease [Terriglobia bacterium]
MTSFPDDPHGVEEASAAHSEAAPGESAGSAQLDAREFLPEDLRVSWSWLHFLIFFLFAFGSLLGVQLAFMGYLASARHLPLKQVEQLLMTEASWVVGMQTLWLAGLLLFLYVTLGILREAPFWTALGWHRFPGPVPPAQRPNAWRYFFSGSALSALVLLGGQGVHPKGKMPIEEIFKDPHGLLLLMGMAVLVAPLMEETLFRGYLYPLLAGKVAGLARGMGHDPERALRIGRGVSIVVTGGLFGMMHGMQTGWTLGIVGMLSAVGMIFTYARARTGTVLASYLLHLGYNSALAVLMAISTGGFRHVPLDH